MKSKHLISIVLAISMLPGFYGSKAYASDMKFTDVPLGFWGISAIQWAYDNKIVDGYPDGTFKPNAPVEQNEFLALLLRAYQPVDLLINDGDSWSAPYRRYENKMRWDFTVVPPPLLGSPSRPTIIYPSRWKVAKLLTQVSGRNYNTKDSIQYVLDSGLAEGRTSHDVEGFKVDENITRAEAVTLIQRLKSKLDVLYEPPYEIEPYNPITLSRSPAENWSLKVLKQGEGGGDPRDFHSELQLDHPTKGYTQTNEAEFELKGRLTRTNDDRLYLQIDKKNDHGFTIVEQADLVFHNSEFKKSILFSSGKGLYRISVQSVSNNENQSMKRIAMFYVESVQGSAEK